MAKKKSKKNGVKIEFLSQSSLKNKSFEDKLDLIMNNVKNQNILVLEEALSPQEKASLIEKSMEECSDDFPGVEFSGFDSEKNWVERIMSMITGKEKKDGLLIVGSASIMEKIQEDKDAISLMAKLD